MDIIKSIEHEQMKNKIPVLKVGDTVRVSIKIKEGNRERIQVFEGIIIKKQHGGINATFTVRRISYGVGVEKTFLLHSPTIEKVEVTRIGKARRAKLFYLRERVGKSAKTKEQIGSKIETNEIQIKEEKQEELEVPETPAEEVIPIEVTEEVVAMEETVEKENKQDEIIEEPSKEEVSNTEPEEKKA